MAFGGASLKEVGQAFRRLDGDKDMCLTWEEFKKGLEKEPPRQVKNASIAGASTIAFDSSAWEKAVSPSHIPLMSLDNARESDLNVFPKAFVESLQESVRVGSFRLDSLLYRVDLYAAALIFEAQGKLPCHLAGAAGNASQVILQESSTGGGGHLALMGGGGHLGLLESHELPGLLKVSKS